MNHNRHPAPAPGISLKDIYFVLFRHKWKIVVLSTLGILSAVAFYFLSPTPFQSEAELFIRYVLDTHSPNPAANGTATSSSELGESIIINELHILTSFDIFQEVATNIGPDKILAKMGGGNDPVQAACVIKQNLAVDAPNNSSIIHLVFHHPDPAIVQPVLREIIAAYLEKHLEVHQSAGTSDDFLTEQTAQLRAQIMETESELLAIKTNAGIISVPEAEKSCAEQIARIRGDLLQAQTELAEQADAPTPGPTNSPVAVVEPPADRLAEYQGVCSRLVFLEKQQDDYLNQQGYTEQNNLVKEVRGQIASVLKLKNRLLAQYPALAAVPTPAPGVSEPQGQAPAGLENVAELRAKIQLLKEQLTQFETEADNVAQAEASIADLQRKKEIQEGNYQYFSTSLEQARIDEALGPGRVSNISAIQTPTPPFKDRSKHLKLMMMMVVGGILAGLAWAFLIEFYIDTSVKRSSEVESKLRLPLFLSIPDITRNGYRKLAGPAIRRRLWAGGGALMKRNPELNVTTWEAGNLLNPFYDALRDRLIAHFENINLTRKPKLVAVTGTNKGAGVSTIAAGLAASLSETGDGRVLLIDMNVERGSARQFVRGEQGCLLDDALIGEKRDSALVQGNLYVVAEGDNNLKLQRVLPKRFATLVPKLKASDYDYIILDMPPVSQTSVTARLAGLMDMTLLVLESEKTERESVIQANALLTLSKANVGAVLNKTRKHVPVGLHREALGDI